jgi:MFS transporter, DHA1 family, multidrug resistance protein
MTATPSRAVPWSIVVLLSGMSAVGPLSIDMYLPSLPTIARALAADASATQATVAIFFAGMAIGQLFYGPASDRFGRRGPVLVGLGLYVLGSMASAFAPNIIVLLLARLAQALGACSSSVIARAIVRDRFDYQQSARFLSLLALIAGVAPILAPSAGALLLTLMGWRGIFAVLGAFGALLWFGIRRRLPESRAEAVAVQARSEHPFRSYAKLMSERRVLGYVAAGACNGAMLFTYIASSPNVLIDQYKVTPMRFGLLIGLNSIGLIGASQLNRMLLRRLPVDRVLAAATLMAVAAAASLLLSAFGRLGGLLGLLIPLFLVVSSAGLIQANSVAGALSVDPLRAGSTAALFGTCSFGAGAVAATLAGALNDGTPRPMALVITACAIGCAVSLRRLALPRETAAVDV